MKIGLLLFKNMIGGIETVSLSIADLLFKQGHDVFFMFPGGLANMNELAVDSRFKVYSHPRSAYRITAKNMIDFMARTINHESSDVVISMFAEESYLLLKARKDIQKNNKIIMMNHSGSCHKYKPFWQDRILGVYEQADALITVTELDEKFYKAKVRTPVATIGNLPRVGFYADVQLKEGGRRGKKILALGRLVKGKGFDLLINSFSKVIDKGWTLHIYGDGPEEEYLKNMISIKGVNHKVWIYPAVQDVPLLMSGHDMFVLPSLAESYGMVLLEALLMGMPCVSFDCPNGPAIIESHLPGCVILVPEKDEVALQAAMQGLIEDEGKRDQLSALALKYRGIVNEEKIALSWENALDCICK
jgi:glycosyltransferase involved in cell wall biosynthesis